MKTTVYRETVEFEKNGKIEKCRIEHHGRLGILVGKIEDPTDQENGKYQIGIVRTSKRFFKNKQFDIVVVSDEFFINESAAWQAGRNLFNVWSKNK